MTSVVLAAAKIGKIPSRGGSTEPNWPRAPPRSPERDLARRIARVLTDVEAAARIARFVGFLVAGGARLAGQLVAEVSAPLVLRRRVAVVELRGIIVDDRDALGAACLAPLARAGDGILSVRRVEQALERAFRYRRASAVVLRISSPGGTASESALLYRKLESLKRRQRRGGIPGPVAAAVLVASLPARLASFCVSIVRRERRPKEEGPRVLAFVDDVCTSGAFYAACAADEIVASPCALVGSIGVITRSFGFARQIRRAGVERRVLASGHAKAGLDPFMPMHRDALARELRVMRDIHEDFVATVLSSRGPKLDRRNAADLAARADAHSWGLKGWLAVWPLRKLTTANRARRGDGLFDGSIHAARTAHRLGLVDAICEDSFVEALRRRYGNRVYIKHIRVGRDYIPISAFLRQQSADAPTSSTPRDHHRVQYASFGSASSSYQTYLGAAAGGVAHQQHQQQPHAPPVHTGKRTRRGGRGRTRRRGRKGREAAALAAADAADLYPWWYAHMVKSGRTPAGVSPSAEDGFPVILPSTQCVYLLPHAKNPHRASTYVPIGATQPTAEDKLKSECADENGSGCDKATTYHPPRAVRFSYGDDLDDDSDELSLADDNSLASETESVCSLASRATSFGSTTSSSRWMWSTAPTMGVMEDDDESVLAPPPLPSYAPSPLSFSWRTPFDQQKSFVNLEQVMGDVARGTKADCVEEEDEEDVAVVSEADDDIEHHKMILFKVDELCQLRDQYLNNDILPSVERVTLEDD
ncbi:hypothetical protein CTAYLR_002482 [Chrysophaeum taylorii]|uniref:Peptidase S49 domain-containing protein n=1 Tax=Chrysophaeum taylorii TaxID=2483200 RepID=A0AAD7UP63_9STRA|nr:hypothetical protein CTAYLR_002482 [Chrysophaeum taylorii]